MQWLIIVALSLHVLASVFWAGTSFALARTGGVAAAQLFKPQMTAASIAVLTGAYLWHLLHDGVAGTSEYLLGAGAACGVAAWTLQLTVGRPTREDNATGRSVEPVAQRVAALLLALAVIGMTAARYA